MKYQIRFFSAAVFVLAFAAATYSAEPTPTTAVEYEARGSKQFIAGKFAESVADFDVEIQLQPARSPWHWKRGISLYYAGRYADGAKQFEGYQTVDGNDVENAVWRFLCQARDPQVGIERARREILTIKNDRRVPMMQIYALYKGDLKPEDVLTAVRADNPSPAELEHRLFYADLYLGLYYEVIGDKALAKRHMDEAERRKIAHYMGDVAVVHAKLLRDPAAK
jgi:lipoprotein NlpI